MYIEFSHVYKKYEEFKDATALTDVSLCIEYEKRMIAIRGHNGAGKSTLLNLLAGLDHPDSGQVIVGTKDLTKLSRNELADYRLQEIGIIFQFFNLFQTYTLFENIAIPGYIAGKSRKTLKHDIEHLADEIGIRGILNKYPHEISGGEMQRTAIARALINKPRILLADEPTGNLDTENAINIYTLLHELATEEKITVIVVTHDERMVTYADQIILMENGRVAL